VGENSVVATLIDDAVDRIDTPVRLHWGGPVARIQRTELEQPVRIGGRLSVHRRSMKGIDRLPAVHDPSLADRRHYPNETRSTRDVEGCAPPGRFAQPGVIHTRGREW
jgi:hypothetical protein